MAYLTDAGIIIKLTDIEKKIKSKNDLYREDVQNSLNAIHGYGFSPDRKKEILKDMIKRTGLKEIGIRTTYTPRDGLKEGEKTYDFLDDLMSYSGVIEN